MAKERAQVQRGSRLSRLARRDTAYFKHGASGYSNWGCRCDVCTAAHSAKMRRARQVRIQKMLAGDPAVPHGTASGYVSWGCRCDPCVAAAAAARAEHPSRRDYKAIYARHQAELRAAAKQRNDESRDRAERHYQPWTGPDLEMALREDLTVAEVAAALGRTQRAVQNIRFKHRHEPRLQNLAGLRQ